MHTRKMTEDNRSVMDQPCSGFKTTTYCRLWKRYTAGNGTFRKNMIFLHRFNYPFIRSNSQDAVVNRTNSDLGKLSLTASQKHILSVLGNFRKLFQLPTTVHCASAQVPKQVTDPVDPTALMEKNYKAFKKHAAASSQTNTTELDVVNYINNQTGMDRLKAVFEKDSWGEPSEEFDRISTQLQCVFGTVFFITMILSGRQAHENFIRQNKTTVFLTKGLAVRRMMESLFVESIKGAFRMTLKLGLFCTTLLCISEGIAIYRNKSSLMEYTVAGGVTGALTRFSLGPKGMVSGGVFGSVVGLAVGAPLVLWYRVIGCTQEERHFRKIQNLMAEGMAMSHANSAKSEPEEDNRDYEID